MVDRNGVPRDPPWSSCREPLENPESAAPTPGASRPTIAQLIVRADLQGTPGRAIDRGKAPDLVDARLKLGLRAVVF
jgi:hypothetical protein